MTDFETRAKEIVKRIYNCNDESFNLSTSGTGLMWNKDLILEALRQAYNDGLRDASDQAVASLASQGPKLPAEPQVAYAIRQLEAVIEAIRVLLKKDV